MTVKDVNNSHLTFHLQFLVEIIILLIRFPNKAKKHTFIIIIRLFLMSGYNMQLFMQNSLLFETISSMTEFIMN